MRRRGRTDANQPALVRDILKLGYSVDSHAALGDGKPDVLIGGQFPCEHCGHYALGNLLGEIKAPKVGRFTPDQLEWQTRWRGRWTVLRTIEDFLRVIRPVPPKPWPGEAATRSQRPSRRKSRSSA